MSIATEDTVKLNTIKFSIDTNVNVEGEIKHLRIKKSHPKTPAIMFDKLLSCLYFLRYEYTIEEAVDFWRITLVEPIELQQVKRLKENIDCANMLEVEVNAKLDWETSVFKQVGQLINNRLTIYGNTQLMRMEMKKFGPPKTTVVNLVNDLEDQGVPVHVIYHFIYTTTQTKLVL